MNKTQRVNEQYTPMTWGTQGTAGEALQVKPCCACQQISAATDSQALQKTLQLTPIPESHMIVLATEPHCIPGCNCCKHCCDFKQSNRAPEQALTICCRR